MQPNSNVPFFLGVNEIVAVFPLNTSISKRDLSGNRAPWKLDHDLAGVLEIRVPNRPRVHVIGLSLWHVFLSYTWRVIVSGPLPSVVRLHF